MLPFTKKVTFHKVRTEEQMDPLIRLRQRHIATHPEFNIPDSPQHVDLQTLADWVKQKPKARVLELGTRRSNVSNPTHHQKLFPGVEFVKTDYQDGLDVDVVVDLHRPFDKLEEGSFDLIVSCSTFEHIKYPHIVAHNLMRLLKPGGRLFLQTHQTYPLHGYKYDYFRFSREALKALFPSTMGMKTLKTEFTHPVAIVPHDRHLHGSWNDVAESYANVSIVTEKISETPNDFLPEFET